jgi:Putative auto-transporter adhesin, head GIN domain
MNTSTFLRNTLAAATLFSLTTVAAWAQDSQLRPVGSFERVEASGAINVVLRQGATTEVKVEAQPDVLARVRTEVEGGTLKLYRERQKGSFSGLGKSEKVTVYVTCPRLTGLAVSGASDVKGESPLTADAFSIKASGASDVTLQITARQLTAHASGASDIRLTGRVDSQQVQVSGASDYRAYELRSQQADVQASGASDAFVYVDGELTSRRSGASDVHYKGNTRLK